MIYDKYARPILSIRLSITQRCNLNCIYCHREGIFNESTIEMSPEEIVKISKICAKHGIKKIKITGGEPLLRDDVNKIIEGISNIKGIKDVSMTTNGIFLEDYAEDLKKAGLKRINISLDTLKPQVFKDITRGGELEKVKAGIESALEAGIKPVKLNMVVMKGINEGEIKDMMEYYAGDGVVLQLIELMNTDREFFEKYFYDLDEIENEFKKEATDVVVRRFMQRRKKYTLNGSQVEVVKPMHNNEFCAHCTRIRITADGKFKPCLMRSDNLVDFLTPMRRGASESELEKLFLDAVARREPYFKPLKI